jgi:predicted dehydrogenase
MATQRLGIIMNGVTGRMGMNQHLIRSIVRDPRPGRRGAVQRRSRDARPILIGRNADKLAALARAHRHRALGTDLARALDDRDDTVFFDAATTQMRPALLRQAIAAGKHVYCEKPIAVDLEQALDIARTAERAGVRNGAVQDKLFLPGLLKLRMLREAGFFGRMLAVRGEFGYWVFEGDLVPAQRPSWNYRKEAGGGIILDMMCHWRYVLDNLFGEVKSVCCRGATHIPERWDENGKPYEATADDAAYAMFELEGGVVATLNSSWCVRVRRDDLVTFQVDGTHGSAVRGVSPTAARRRASTTPKPVWNPDVRQTLDFYEGWELVPDTVAYDNGFKVQWELFIRHVVEGAPFKWTLREGAKGVQLVELAQRSWQERRWIDVPPLPA